MAYYAVLAAKGFLPRGRCPASARSARCSGCIRTASWCRAWKSPADRSATGCRWPWGWRWVCAPRGCRVARVFVLVGDAELDEGSNHEAIAFAGAGRLDPLTRWWSTTHSSTWGWPGGIEARFSRRGLVGAPSTAGTTTGWPPR